MQLTFIIFFRKQNEKVIFYAKSLSSYFLIKLF